MSKIFLVTTLIGLVILATFVFFQFSGVGTQVLWDLSAGGKWFLPLVVVSSVIDSINPCAFSILLLTVAFLFSLGRERKEILKIGGVYILGIFTVYILIGLGILQTLHIFGVPHFMGKVGAGVAIFWGGLGLLNFFFPQFPIKLAIPTFSHQRLAGLIHRATVPAALALGALVGLCEFPCTGGPYLMILGLLHDRGTWWSGLGYLLLYNVIFVAPLLVILVLSSRRELYDRVRRFKSENNKLVSFLAPAAMIILGVWLLRL